MSCVGWAQARTVQTYGIHEGATWQAVDVQGTECGGTSFIVLHKGGWAESE